jgi:hypothetical protein
MRKVVVIPFTLRPQRESGYRVPARPPDCRFILFRQKRSSKKTFLCDRWMKTGPVLPHALKSDLISEGCTARCQGQAQILFHNPKSYAPAREMIMPVKRNAYCLLRHESNFKMDTTQQLQRYVSRLTPTAVNPSPVPRRRELHLSSFVPIAAAMKMLSCGSIVTVLFLESRRWLFLPPQRVTITRQGPG